MVLDTFSRKVVGWAIDSSPNAQLVTNALGMAIDTRSPKAGTVIHSDHGTVFTSWVFTQRAKNAGLLPSMGAIGSCYDNSMIEFFWGDIFLLRLHQIIDRAVQSNMFSVFTDCPHREKLGWLEQLHYCFNVLARLYDVQAHLNDIVRHIIEAQTSDGLVPNIAPELVVFNEYAVKCGIDAFRSDPNWGRAIVDVPWLLYRQYGDSQAISEALPTVTRYLSYLEARASNDILDFG